MDSNQENEKEDKEKVNEEKKENDINLIKDSENKKVTEINEDNNKKTEIDNNGINYFYTKSDFNLTSSFEDFENKIQELKDKINQNKMGKTFNITNSNNKNFSATQNLNIKKLNDNSMTRNKLKELFTLIGGPGKENGKTSLMNNKPPITFNNLNSPINNYKKSYSKISTKKNNNNTNNRLIYKNIPAKRNNDKNIIKNKTPSKSFGFSTFYSNQKKNNNNNNNNNNKDNKGKNYLKYFKPITMNSIRNTSFNKQENKKKENIFNKKYYRGELDNFNYLLFGNDSSKKYGKKNNKEEETIDPFFNPPIKTSLNQKFNFRTINGGDNFFSSKYTGVNNNIPKINMII